MYNLEFKLAAITNPEALDICFSKMTAVNPTYHNAAYSRRMARISLLC
jgi:hypothetical protein